MSIDYLSALPDDILCYILSFLEMKEAAITSLVSKRWQFLWTKLPAILFDAGGYFWETEEIRKFVNRVNRSLAICSRRNLERFEVYFSVSEPLMCFASDVDGWIRFAVEHKVKRFVLLLPNEYIYYVLPQTTYSNPSLITLSLRGCIVAPPGTIRWQSLTTLRVEFLELSNTAFEKICSGCPVLSSVDLMSCWGFDRLEVNTPSLHTLTIEYAYDAGNLEISAPHLHTLRILWNSVYKNLSLKNMKSLVRAELDDFWGKGEDPELVKKGIKDLFGSIRHVKMFRLSHRFTEFLSSIAWNWQLPESTTKCLELHVFRDKISIPGIALLLESSPNLETLVIRGRELSYSAYVQQTSTDDLDCDLYHLKTVRFENFGDSNLDTGEPMLTLARILLKRAIFLEKIVVDFRESTASSAPTAFYKVVQKLISYPRSSPKAVVLFR